MTPTTALSAYDFDGTVTDRDTLIGFIRHAVGTPRMVVGFALHAPLLPLMKAGLIDSGKVKERIFGHFFKGMTKERFDALCRSYAENNTSILRPDAMRSIRSDLDAGRRVAVVTASIADWVKPFFGKTIVTVIATEAQVRDGMLTGRFSTPNCRGAEKVRRLREIFPHDQYPLADAYGDSAGDRELLAAAQKPHYREFRAHSDK